MKTKEKFDCIVALSASGASFYGVADDRYEPSAASRGSSSSATLLSALRGAGCKRGCRVLVLLDGVFTQQVNVPDVQTAGLAPEELETALFYEVEPFTDIPKAEGVFSYARVSAGAWNVLQVRAAEVEACRDAVRQARCEFAGVAALPVGFVPEAAGAAEMLRGLVRGEADLPVAVAVRHAKGHLPGNFGKYAAIAIGALAILCAADWFHLASSLKVVLPRLAVLERLAAENNALQDEVRTTEAKTREIKEAAARREEARKRLAASRDAWLRLTEVLRDKCGDDVVIRSISSGREFSATVNAFAASADGAASSMARLSAELKPLGWSLAPGAGTESAGGLSFSFSFDVAFDAGKAVR